MIIYDFIRHGESEANATGSHIVCGRSSATPLTQNGRTQAELLGNWYREEKVLIDQVFASKAVRATDTARLIAQSMNLEDHTFQAIDDIEEKDQGTWTGTPHSKVYTPETLRVMNESDGNFAPPGGESERQAAARLYKQLIEVILPRTDDANHVAIVSHGNVIRCMLQYVFDYPVNHKNGLKNTSITRLLYDEKSPQKFQVIFFNQVQHLENL